MNMLTIRKKRRMIGVAKLALLALAAVIVLTPKNVDFGPIMSLSIVGQAMASE